MSRTCPHPIHDINIRTHVHTHVNSYSTYVRVCAPVCMHMTVSLLNASAMARDRDRYLYNGCAQYAWKLPLLYARTATTYRKCQELPLCTHCVGLHSCMYAGVCVCGLLGARDTVCNVCECVCMYACVRACVYVCVCVTTCMDLWKRIRTYWVRSLGL